MAGQAHKEIETLSHWAVKEKFTPTWALGVIFVGTATPSVFASARMVHQTKLFWDDLGVQVLCLVGRKLWLCKTRNKEFLNEQIDQNDRNCLELLTWK